MIPDQMKLISRRCWTADISINESNEIFFLLLVSDSIVYFEFLLSLVLGISYYYCYSYIYIYASALHTVNCANRNCLLLFWFQKYVSSTSTLKSEEKKKRSIAFALMVVCGVSINRYNCIVCNCLDFIVRAKATVARVPHFYCSAFQMRASILEKFGGIRKCSRLFHKIFKIYIAPFCCETFRIRIARGGH